MIKIKALGLIIIALLSLSCCGQMTNIQDNNITTKTQEDLELVGGIKGTTVRYDGYFAHYISGIVKNNTTKKYSYVQITFNLYDKDGNKVGTALANENDLGAGETWKFEAIGFDDFATYKLNEIIGW